jgi:hypothetical protein
VSDLIRAKQCLDGGDYARAHAICERELKRDPHNVEALMVFGLMLFRSGQYGAAYHILQRAYAYEPNGDILQNIAACLDYENPAHLDEALTLGEKALETTTDLPAALTHLSSVYLNKREPDKAIHFAEQAIAINPDAAAAKWSAALAYLAKREWKKGWAWYDETLGVEELKKSRPPLRDFSREGEEPTPMWDGQGGTVAVSSEQGIGDEIMFASCIPDAVDAAETIVLECDPRLVNLYQRSFPRVAVTARRKGNVLVTHEPREYTHTIPVGSLPRLFRNDDKDFPGTAYLKPDPERHLQWRALRGGTWQKYVGVNWTGGLDDTGKSKRSVSLETLLPILRKPDINFVSLNHRPEAEDEIARLTRDHGISLKHWPRALGTNDYDDTAALVSALDAVVTVTSAIVHLAGALGTKAYVLVPAKPRWSYGLTGRDMPWYKSVQLYRQPKDDNWITPVMQIAEVL